MKGKFLMALAALVLMVGCRDRYTEVPISAPTTIGKDWIELHPSKPLVWKDPAEEFSFHIDTPHQRSERAEIIATNGERCVPEVRLVTESGDALSPEAHGFWGEDMYFYWSRGEAKREPIRAIRVRSDIRLQISSIIWRGYDPSKVKR